MTEEQFQQQVIDLAAATGWFHFHDYDSRRSVEGFPDLLLTRPPQLIVMELKVGRRKATEAQLAWLDRFRACGIPAFLFYDTDFVTIQQILTRRLTAEEVRALAAPFAPA